MTAHDTREGWLAAATEALHPAFSDAGLTIPGNIRFAVAFPSSGGRSSTVGECWYPEASSDGYVQIIIRADHDEPGEVLAILIHELVHACLPAEAGHGKVFKRHATALGLTGKMTATVPDIDLIARLSVLSESIGALPHGKLDYAGVAADTPKKQGTRMLKAFCVCDGCGYVVRITRKWAEQGLPVCPIGSRHGMLTCEGLNEEPEESA